MKTTRLHLIPVGDEQHGKLKLHAAALDCWCHPSEQDDVVTHNAFDCREKLERQDVATGKIWVHVLENKQPDELRPEETPEFSAALVVGLLARNMEQALRSHMTNYGGASYAESAIAKIKEETMKALPNITQS